MSDNYHEQTYLIRVNLRSEPEDMLTWITAHLCKKCHAFVVNESPDGDPHEQWHKSQEQIVIK